MIFRRYSFVQIKSLLLLSAIAAVLALTSNLAYAQSLGWPYKPQITGIETSHTGSGVVWRCPLGNNLTTEISLVTVTRSDTSLPLQLPVMSRASSCNLSCTANHWPGIVAYLNRWRPLLFRAYGASPYYYYPAANMEVRSLAIELVTKVCGGQ